MSAVRREWWLAALTDRLVWARVSEHESGIAHVLDASGNTHTYEDVQTAHAALMDAGFRAFDGLDAEDAAQMGFVLASASPPQGEDDEALVARMMQPLPK